MAPLMAFLNFRTDGPIGAGKTFTLNHLLHYGYNEKFVLLFCPKRKTFFLHCFQIFIFSYLFRQQLIGQGSLKNIQCHRKMLNELTRHLMRQYGSSISKLKI